MFNNYEIVEYIHSLPLQIQSFTGRTTQDDRGDIKDVLEHWHQEIEMPETTTWKSYSHGSIRFVDSVNMKTGRTYEKTKVFSYVLLSYRSMQEINQVPTY